MNEPTGPRPVLQVWLDLQCPDCHLAQQDVQALRARYGQALDIQLRHFPLAKHRHAHTAAQAAEEAYAQGRGDAFVEALLARTDELTRLGEPTLLSVATDLGLDVAELETALVDGRHLLVVDADQAEGEALGITGTPTYRIGGERLDGGRSQEGLRERITEIADRLLADYPAES